MPDDRLTGERIAYHRKRLGLSQVEFAGLVGRSESWVSQVERGVRPVDRMSVLQRVADVLSVSVAELTGGDDTPVADERPEAFDTIRLALTGHPAIASVIGTVRPAPAKHIEALRRQHAEIWDWSTPAATPSWPPSSPLSSPAWKPRPALLPASRTGPRPASCSATPTRPPPR